MKRLLALTLLLAACSEAAVPETDPAEWPARIRQDVERLTAATRAGDVPTIVDLTHERLVDQVGGREELISFMNGSLEQMKQQQVTFDSIEVLSVGTPVEHEGTLYALCTTETVMGRSDGRLRQRTSLIGISEDRGATWSYVSDGRASNPAQWEQMFPGVADAIGMPDPVPPEFTPR